MRTGRTDRIAPDRRGVTAVIVALLLVPLIGLLGVAIDVGMLYQERRTAQLAADAAALAGAREIYTRELDPVRVEDAARNEATQNGVTDGVSGASVAVTVDMSARRVEVGITRDVPTLFAGIFGRSIVGVQARSVAGMSAASSTCVQVLNRTDDGAITVDGGGRLAAQCGIVVASPGTSAIQINAGSLSAPSILVNGRANAVIANLQELSPRTVDPFPEPPAPDIPPLGCSAAATDTTVVSADSTLSCGVYDGGIRIQTGAVARLENGVYVLRGGGLIIEGTGRIELLSPGPGNGVVIVYATGLDSVPSPSSFHFSNDATVRLRAMESGPLRGIVFYQPRSLSSQPAARFSGSTFDVQGTFYLPRASVEFANPGPAKVVGSMIVDKLRLSGTGILTIPGRTALSADTTFYTLRRVALVP